MFKAPFASFSLSNRPAAVLLILLAVFASHPGAASIYELDDRVTTKDADRHLGRIGLVKEHATGGHGTGFLIGACHALTARHIVRHPEPMGRRVTFRLEPGKRSSPSNSTSGVVIAAGGKPAHIADLSQDWILVRLERCLGRRFGHFRLGKDPLVPTPRVPIGGPSLSAIGFPYDRDVKRGPVIDPNCNLRLVTRFGLFHDCATLPGNSGGPIIRWNSVSKDYEVVAMIVAGHNRPSPQPFNLIDANVAVSIGPLVDLLRPYVAEVPRSPMALGMLGAH